jgi:hypothetical protein
MPNEDGFGQILKLLASTRGFLCQDPQDHVSSCISPLSASEAAGFTIDYSLSPGEVYS